MINWKLIDIFKNILMTYISSILKLFHIIIAKK